MALKKITRYPEPSRPWSNPPRNFPPLIRRDEPRPPYRDRIPTTYISRQDQEEMIAEGLCFYCKDKYEKGHKCKKLRLFEVIEHSSDEEEQPPMTTESTIPQVQEEDPKLITNIDSVCHLLADLDRPNAMRVLGKLGEKRVLVLLDSGATHNFVSEQVAKENNCEKETQPPLKVLVANGASLSYNNKCKDVELLLQKDEQGTVTEREAKSGLSARVVGGEGGHAKALGPDTSREDQHLGADSTKEGQIESLSSGLGLVHPSVGLDPSPSGGLE
ncbi:hypothetical protein EJ110_NYTH12891 [Nymphaea thermarum]|nr:hypothetical protein EJ110_NYTH12891 [Nymphaea thermarum]